MHLISAVYCVCYVPANLVNHRQSSSVAGIKERAWCPLMVTAKMPNSTNQWVPIATQPNTSY